MPKALLEQTATSPKEPKTIVLPDAISDFQLLGSDQVAKIINYSQVHLRRLVHSGEFPAPKLVGGRKFAWPVSVIRSHLDNLGTARNQIKSPK